MEEAKKLKELQAKASGKGPLSTIIFTLFMYLLFCSQWWYQKVQINELFF